MDATVAELKNYLTTYADRFLKKDTNNKKMYQCPFCGSGSHGKASTGAFSIKENMFKCFSCGTTGDIFTLHAKLHGLNEKQDFVQIKKELCEIFGVKDNTVYASSKSSYSQNEEAATDYTEFFKECHARINDTDYLKRRGITNQKVIDRFMLGYAPNWKHPNATERVIPTDRLIIPVSKRTYTARNVKPTEQMNDVEKQYKKQKVGQGNWLFNTNALKDATSPIWIVEGELDAISIYEVGGEAVALGSLTNIKHFVEFVKKNRPSQLLIIALDNDNQGREKSLELTNLLFDNDIPFLTSPLEKINHPYKDINEFLQYDRETLTEVVQELKKDNEDIIWNDEQCHSPGEKIINQIGRQMCQSYYEFHDDIFMYGRLFTHFDEILEHHPHPFHGVFCLCGKPSVGKSILMQNFAFQSYDIEQILYCSNTRSTETFYSDFLVYQMMNSLRTNELYSSSELLESWYTDIGYSHEKFSNLKRIIKSNSGKYSYIDQLRFIPAYNFTLSNLYEAIQELSKIKTPIIYIDDIQIFSDSLGFEDTFRQLNRMAQEFNVRILVTYPDSYDKLRETFIPSLVDVIWELEEYSSSNKRLLKCYKNRYGDYYNVMFDFDPKYHYFKVIH